MYHATMIVNNGEKETDVLTGPVICYQIREKDGNHRSFCK